MMHATILATKRRMNLRQLSFGRWRPVLLGALALVAAGPAAWATSSTSTTLFTTPQNPSSGAVITMTAQVSSFEYTVAGGSVTFFDTYNGVTEALGTVQVQSTNGSPGTAIFETEVGGVGSHQFLATYNGTGFFITSSSQPQAVNFVAPYRSAVALSSTGSGSNYTLTGTVSAFGPSAPSGSVTFTDTTSGVVLGTGTLNSATLLTGFTSSQNYAIANMNNGQTGSTIGPAIGDFNGDGRPDYAVPTNGGPIAILLGNGDGTFTTGFTVLTSSFEPTSVVAGDFNGDGKQDLAVLSAAGTGSVNIYLGNGNGTFQTAKNYAVAAATSSSRLLAMGDFNGDGILDLVATNAGLGNVAVILGVGDGSFNAPSYYSVGASPWNVVVGDINKDGIQDIAVASDSSSSVSILQGNGDGTFKTVIYANTGAGQAGSVALGDFNGDGYPDLATTSAGDNGVYVLLNKGTATPSFGTAAKFTMNTGPYYLTIGDFNRDGRIDILSANNGNSTVGVMLGDGTGNFAAATYYSLGGGAIFANEGDINGDDQVDLTAVTANGLSVLLSGQSETASNSNVAFYGCSSQSVTAIYSGDGNYATSTSPVQTFTPTKQNTALTITVMPSIVNQGQQATLTATLSPYNYGSTSTNTETITFRNNGTAFGTATLSGGVATLVATPPVTGNYSVDAVYGGDCSFNGSNSNVISGTVALPSTLSWSTPAAITYGTPLSGTQLNATDAVNGTALAGTYVYSPASGTVLPAGTSTLSVTFTPSNTQYGPETGTVQITVNQDPTYITWPTPTPITYGTPLSGFQLDASVSSGVVAVDLSSYYNVYGIYTPGSTYSTGGFDNDGYSYSSSKLNSAVTWNGMTFNIGPANAPDAVYGSLITLPPGKYTNLYFLAGMVNNISASQTFTVTYTDNSTVMLTQNMSDWVNAAGWPGESVVNCNFDRNFYDGSTQPYSVCVYGYQIPLDPTKTVQSVQLPSGNRNIVVLAMDLTTPSIPGTFVYNPPAGTIEPVGTDTLSVAFTPTDTQDYKSSTASVQLVVGTPVTPIVTPTISWPTPAPITYGTLLSSTQLDAVAMGAPRPTPVVPTSQLQVLSTSTDGVAFNLGGFDNGGNAYSYNALGNGSVNFAGTTFTLGQPGVPNAITNGAVYNLPAQGNYSMVYLLGAATTTGQTSQPFTLTYSTGNPVTALVDMSSWAQSAGYADESIVATTSYKNVQSGGTVSGTYDLYGYQIPADPTRTLVSVTVPNNRNVVIMALGFGTNTQVVVPGTYTYNPAAGTKLAVGSHTLNVSFTPSNSSGYTTATGSTTIVVNQATPVLNWPTPAAIATGTALSSTQLNATASFQGSTLPGTFFYTVPPGTTSAQGVVLSAGTHTLQVVFTPTDTTDFTTATATVQIVVGNTGSSGVSGAPLYSSGDCCFFSQPTPYTVTVSGSTVAPTGNISVTFSGQNIGTGTLVPGSGASSTATLMLNSIYFYPGNNTVTLNYLGDSNYVPNTNSAVVILRNPAIEGDPASAPSGTSTIQIPYTYVVAGAMTFNFNPGGGAASDFSNGGATTCSSGTPQPAGTVCILSVAFTPALPGIREGVVQVDFAPTGGGQAEPTLYLFLSGLGDAAQISLSSATQVSLNTSLNSPQSVTFNPTDKLNATLYVANSNVGQLDTLSSSTAGGLTRWNASNSGNLVYPSDLVFDVFGNLVVSDATGAKVYKFNPALAETTMGTGTYTLGLPTASRFDFGGNLYIADAGSSPRIIEIPGETYAAYTPSLLSLGSYSVSFPQALSVDNTGGNLYVGDGNTNQVLKIGLNGSGVTPLTLGPCDGTVTSCAINSPAGFAFDPNGDMFITDSGARVLMVPATHSSGGLTTQVPLTGLLNPTGVTLDGSGNIYVSDLNGSVTKLMVNAGSMTIATVGASQTTTVTNTGNLNLTITSLALANGASSSFSETDTCTGVSIAPGGTCTIKVTYSNGSGTPIDTLTINSNAFSSTGVTIALKN
jgi:FG-GAP-like repeat/Bacterial Ig-like domain (group 3)